MTDPRPLSMCNFTPPKGYEDQYPMSTNCMYVFLGEIPNMPGHCVVVEHETGLVYSGYHIDNFTEIEE